MSYRQKKALEIAMRDTMDGMEALASMLSYRRLPDDLEILGIGEEACPEITVTPPPLLCAQIIELDDFRPAVAAEPSCQAPEVVVSAQGKNNKIIML